MYHSVHRSILRKLYGEHSRKDLFSPENFFEIVPDNDTQHLSSLYHVTTCACCQGGFLGSLHQYTACACCQGGFLGGFPMLWHSRFLWKYLRSWGTYTKLFNILNTTDKSTSLISIFILIFIVIKSCMISYFQSLIIFQVFTLFSAGIRRTRATCL